MAKYIRFEVSFQTFGGKQVYQIVNKRSQEPIGNVFWYPRWRKWVARFDEDSVWSDDCLQEVMDFIRLTSKGKDHVVESTRQALNGPSVRRTLRAGP